MNFICTKIDSFKINAFIPNTVNIDSSIIKECNTSLQYKPTSSNNQNNNSMDISISFAVSVTTFILGFIITEAIRRKNKSYRLNQYKQFIEEWVKKSNRTLQKYIISLDQFSNEIKENTDLNVARWRTGIIHLSEINKIPLEEFADIYIFGLSKNIDNENRKQLMNFLYQLEYLNKVTSLIMDVYDKYCENNNKIMKEWNIYYMQLLDLFGNIKEVNPQNNEGATFLKISSLFVPLINTRDGKFAGTEKWKNEFILPAIEILSDEECLNSTILRQIMIIIRNLNIVLMKHANLNDYSKIFMDYADNLRESQKIINTSISYFSDKSIRPLCR